MPKLAIYSSPTIDEINAAIKRIAPDWRRLHCGGSGIGDDCERAIYYNFRWTTAPDHSGRILRLFRRGQLEEMVFVEDLRSSGVEVREGPSEGEQYKFSALNGHFGGSIDGLALGIKEAPKTWHILEFKTHSKKSFDDLIKKGVEKSKPVHFAQMQTYMHLSKQDGASGVGWAFYMAVCKDDDRLYTERVQYDRYYASEIMDKAKRIIFAEEPPRRISNKPDFYRCKWCDHYEVCHQDGVPEVNCRTCKHSEVRRPGWFCKKHNIAILPEKQKEGCSQYEMGEM